MRNVVFAVAAVLLHVLDLLQMLPDTRGIDIVAGIHMDSDIDGMGVRQCC